MNEIRWTSNPKMATVVARLTGGANSERPGGHQPNRTATYATAVTIYSTAKIVEKTQRNGETSGERKVVSARISPTAPMLSSAASTERPRTSPPAFATPATKADAAARATPMLKCLTTGNSAWWERARQGGGFWHI